MIKCNLQKEEFSIWMKAEVQTNKTLPKQFRQSCCEQDAAKIKMIKFAERINENLFSKTLVVLFRISTPLSCASIGTVGAHKIKDTNLA